MNIIVCIKQVPNPEAPVNQYTVDSTGKRMVVGPGVTPVFEQHAVEAALQLKEAHGGKVTALSLGPVTSLQALKRTLRMGVEEAVLVDGESLPEPAPHATAYILAKAIEKIGNYHLILCDWQAGDWDQGQVGCFIAECLNLPCVNIVKHIEVIEDGSLRVQRLAEDGYEVMELPVPALLTVTTEINQPRLTTIAGVLRASKMNIPVWSTQDISAEPDSLEVLSSLINIESLYIPEIRSECQMMEVEKPEEAAANLVKALRLRKII